MRSRAAGRAVLVTGAIGLVATSVGFITVLSSQGLPLAVAAPVAVLAFVAALVVIRRALRVVRLPTAFALLLVACAQSAGLLAAPVTSSDVYRYAWDGRVQLAGVDPYRYPPDDPALASLRPAWLFPDGETLLNRPGVPTIYPPVAQALFATVAAVDRHGLTGIRLLAAAAVVATAAVLRRGRAPTSVVDLAYGTCPLVTLEAGNGGHLDAVVALLTLAVVGRAARGRMLQAGALLGVAVAVKITPLLLLPALVRRGGTRLLGTALVVPALTYVPHLLVVGGGVAGFLPGYLHEEGYGNGARFVLLLPLPAPWRPVLAGAAAVALALLAFARSRGEEPVVTCCRLFGCAMLVATPIYPWYALPLAALSLRSRRYEWLLVCAAAYVAFVGWAHAAVQAGGYALGAVGVAGTALARRRRRKVPEPARALPGVATAPTVEP